VFECRNCAGREARPIYRDVPDRLHGFDGAFTYVACRGCELVQLEDIPANLGAFYADYRVHAQDTRAYRLLRKLMIGHCYYKQQGRGRTMLDIGCGNGFYMKEMAELGWRPVGYELDKDHAAALSQQLGMPVLGGEAALEAHPAEFDLITFNFSFEHLDRPLRLLDLASSKLRPGGELYIAVPNIDGREASLFKDRWFHLDPPRQVSFFSKQLLRKLLEQRGFTDVAVKDLAVPTGFAGSVSYTLLGGFKPLAWYAGMVPGVVFSAIVRDGNFAISGRRPS
jgi:SAM-dependent methyltransferase